VRNVALALGVTALALGAAEIAVRLLVPVRNVGPSYSTYDPVYGKRLKRNFHAVRYTPEFTNSLTTNSLGFRGPEPDSASGGSALFIGDSFTMGYGVNDGEEFPELVRRALVAKNPHLGVVNSGMGDNGNGRWIKFLRGDAKRFDPRVVVLQISENDFSDNRKEGLFAIGPGGALVEKPIPQPGWSRTAQDWIEAIPGLDYSYLIGLLRQAQPARGGAAPQRTATAAADSLTYRLLEESLALCERAGWPVLGLEVGVEGPRLASLQEIFRRQGADLIEAPTRSARPDLYYQTDGHWNAKGHQWVAAAVLDRMMGSAALR